MSDEPVVFNVTFSLPAHYSYKRNPAGGARLTIDIERDSVKAVESMIDLAEVSSGVLFYAPVLVVKTPPVVGKRNKKKADPEWGDDDESDDTG